MTVACLVVSEVVETVVELIVVSELEMRSVELSDKWVEDFVISEDVETLVDSLVISELKMGLVDLSDKLVDDSPAI